MPGNDEKLEITGDGAYLLTTSTTFSQGSSAFLNHSRPLLIDLKGATPKRVCTLFPNLASGSDICFY